MTPRAARRTALLAAALSAGALCAAALPPATAMPYAGVLRGGDAVFAIVGQDGRRWQLHLHPDYSTAVSTSNGRNVVVTLTQCTGRTCSYSKTWQVALGAGDLTESTDGSTFAVTADLGGTELTATFVRGGSVNTGGTTILIGAPAVVQTDVWEAAVSLEWGWLACDTEAAQAYEQRRVDGVNGQPFAAGPKAPKLPRGFSGPRTRCG